MTYYLAKAYKTLWKFVTIVRKHERRDYVGDIWNQSENVFKSFTANSKQLASEMNFQNAAYNTSTRGFEYFRESPQILFLSQSENTSARTRQKWTVGNTASFVKEKCANWKKEDGRSDWLILLLRGSSKKQWLP